MSLCLILLTVFSYWKMWKIRWAALHSRKTRSLENWVVRAVVINMLCFFCVVILFKADWPFVSMMCCDFKVTVRHAGSSWTWRHLRKNTKQSKASASPLVRLIFRLLSAGSYWFCELICFFFFFHSSTTEMRRKASPWQRNLGYPLAMLVLLALTVHTLIKSVHLL